MVQATLVALLLAAISFSKSDIEGQYQINRLNKTYSLAIKRGSLLKIERKTVSEDLQYILLLYKKRLSLKRKVNEIQKDIEFLLKMNTLAELSRYKKLRSDTQSLIQDLRRHQERAQQYEDELYLWNEKIKDAGLEHANIIGDGWLAHYERDQATARDFIRVFANPRLRQMLNRPEKISQSEVSHAVFRSSLSTSKAKLSAKKATISYLKRNGLLQDEEK